MDLISKVQDPRNPFITNPAMMHLISEMPEPAAYGAKDRTRLAEVNAKIILARVSDLSCMRKKPSYRDYHIKEIIDGPD